MAKKIGWGIAIAVLLLGATVFAAENEQSVTVWKDMKAIFKGMLSPQQMGTLMDFRRDHQERFRGMAGDRTDLLEWWKALDLSEEQQGQLLKIAGDLVDKIHPSLIAFVETGRELKQKTLEGDPADPAIDQLSSEIGREMGGMFWNFSLARVQMRSVLTPGQMDIIERHRTGHDLRRKKFIEGLPGRAEDFAALWNDLKLTPNQVDSLGAAHRLLMKYRQNRHAGQHDGWRAEIEKILTPEQAAVAERFHGKHVAAGKERLGKMAEERERFQNELGLSGEQKLKLIQLAFDRRAQIVPAIQEVMKAAGGLRAAVYAEIPDRSAFTAAGAQLGDAVGRAARVGAGLRMDAREVLTPEQMNRVEGYFSDRWDGHLGHARMLPFKFHELVDLLNELALTPAQKDQVVKLISEKHKAQRPRHLGMKNWF